MGSSATCSTTGPVGCSARSATSSCASSASPRPRRSTPRWSGDALRNLRSRTRSRARPLARGGRRCRFARCCEDAAERAFGDTPDERLLRQVLLRGYWHAERVAVTGDLLQDGDVAWVPFGWAVAGGRAGRDDRLDGADRGARAADDDPGPWPARRRRRPAAVAANLERLRALPRAARAAVWHAVRRVLVSHLMTQPRYAAALAGLPWAASAAAAVSSDAGGEWCSVRWGAGRAWRGRARRRRLRHERSRTRPRGPLAVGPGAPRIPPAQPAWPPASAARGYDRSEPGAVRYVGAVNPRVLDRQVVDLPMVAPMVDVFKALADPTRRAILDELRGPGRADPVRDLRAADDEARPRPRRGRRSRSTSTCWSRPAWSRPGARAGTSSTTSTPHRSNAIVERWPEAATAGSGPTMRDHLITSVLVDDQDKALRVLHRRAGLREEARRPDGRAPLADRGLAARTRTAPNCCWSPAAIRRSKPFKRALVEDGIPFTSFARRRRPRRARAAPRRSACASPRSRRDGPGDDRGVRRHLRQPDPDRESGLIVAQAVPVLPCAPAVEPPEADPDVEAEQQVAREAAERVRDDREPSPSARARPRARTRRPPRPRGPA